VHEIMQTAIMRVNKPCRKVVTIQAERHQNSQSTVVSARNGRSPVHGLKLRPAQIRRYDIPKRMKSTHSHSRVGTSSRFIYSPMPRTIISSISFLITQHKTSGQCYIDKNNKKVQYDQSSKAANKKQTKTTRDQNPKHLHRSSSP
jgi:hypothetical protein